MRAPRFRRRRRGRAHLVWQGDPRRSFHHAPLVGTRTAGSPSGRAGRKVRVESARDRLPVCRRFLVGRCGVDRDDDRFPSAVGHDGKDRAADDVGGEQALPVGGPGSGTAERRTREVWMILARPRRDCRIRPHLHGGAGQRPGRIDDDGAVVPIGDPRSVGGPRRPEPAIDAGQVAAGQVKDLDRAPAGRWSEDETLRRGVRRPRDRIGRSICSGPTACRSAPSARATYRVALAYVRHRRGNEGDAIPGRRPPCGPQFDVGRRH